MSPACGEGCTSTAEEATPVYANPPIHPVSGPTGLWVCCKFCKDGKPVAQQHVFATSAGLGEDYSEACNTVNTFPGAEFCGATPGDCPGSVWVSEPATIGSGTTLARGRDPAFGPESRPIFSTSPSSPDCCVEAFADLTAQGQSFVCGGNMVPYYTAGHELKIDLKPGGDILPEGAPEIYKQKHTGPKTLPKSDPTDPSVKNEHFYVFEASCGYTGPCDQCGFEQTIEIGGNANQKLLKGYTKTLKDWRASKNSEGKPQVPYEGNAGKEGEDASRGTAIHDKVENRVKCCEEKSRLTFVDAPSALDGACGRLLFTSCFKSSSDSCDYASCCVRFFLNISKTGITLEFLDSYCKGGKKGFAKKGGGPLIDGFALHDIIASETGCE